MLLYVSSLLHYINDPCAWVLPETIEPSIILGAFSDATIRSIRSARNRLPTVCPYRSNADLQEEIDAVLNPVQIDPEAVVPVAEDFVFNRYPLFPLSNSIDFDFNFFGLDLLESYMVDSLRVATRF